MKNVKIYIITIINIYSLKFIKTEKIIISAEVLR